MIILLLFSVKLIALKKDRNGRENPPTVGIELSWAFRTREVRHLSGEAMIGCSPGSTATL